jgi:hypothetical protein
MAPRAPKKTDPADTKPTAAKTTTARKRTVKAVDAQQPTAEQIAMAAYFIAISGEGGDDTENWLRAEQQLTSRAA